MATGRIGTTPVLQVRWSKAPSAGTTSLSGLDDNSVSLVYSVGYEAVYRNGVLLSRTNDYTATDGTTITLIDATIAGDIIEVFANQTIPLADTYSQTVANGKFINNTLTTTTGDIIYASAANTPARLGIGSTDQVLKVSGGIPAWGAASSGLTKITSSSFSAAATVSVNDCFSATYDHYRIIIEVVASAAQDIAQRWRVSGSDNTSAIYDYGYVYVTGTAGPTRASANNATSNTWAYNGTGEPSYISVDVYYPFLSTRQTGFTGLSMSYEADSSANYIGGNHNSNGSFTGFTLFPKTSGTITGKVTVYGYQI